MKDKYTPVPDTPVLIRAKRAYLNASDVSTPGAPTAASAWILCEKNQEKNSVGTKHAKQNIKYLNVPIKGVPLFACPFPFEIRTIIKF